MIENYIKEADRVTYLMPKEVDHHCAGQIIAELDALIEGCGVRKTIAFKSSICILKIHHLYLYYTPNHQNINLNFDDLFDDFR